MWNKIPAIMVLGTAASLLITSIEAEARGGGRGGGGGGRSGGAGRGGGASVGGGSYRGGQVMNRTPTMSRASSKPAVSQARQSNVQQARQQVQRPSAPNRTEMRSQISQYAQNKSVQPIDSQAFAQKAQNFSSQRSNQISQNRQLSDSVSQRLQQAQPGVNRWFDQSFFDSHNIGLDYARTGANWWRPATWATLTGWGAWGWSTPYYYDDGGYAYPVTITSSTTSYDTTPTQSSQSAAEGDWLPLGVFAVASNASQAAQTNHFIQLTVNRKGEIAGVLYNSLTNTANDLTGMVDPTSQKAYWYMSNKPNAPISSTGLYNLTEDQTPINVHFSDGSDQPWTLVRLQQ